MPRSVNPHDRAQAIHMMLSENMGQREIHRETGLSRPYLRRLAREVGYQFPRNGIEVVGQLCMCSNCGTLFRRAKSKIKSKHTFCEESCRIAYTKGKNHPNWKTGKSARTFSSWIVNQAKYREWREAVLDNYDRRCAITGSTEDVEAHHIMPKSTSQQFSFDVENGIALSKRVHNRIHQLMSDGMAFEPALEVVKQEFEAKE